MEYPESQKRLQVVLDVGRRSVPLVNIPAQSGYCVCPLVQSAWEATFEAKVT